MASITDKLMSLDGGFSVEFVVEEAVQNQNGFWTRKVRIKRSDRNWREIDIPSLSPFTALMSSLFFIGVELRSLQRDLRIEFDLDGQSFDTYIPLPQEIRTICDE